VEKRRRNKSGAEEDSPELKTVDMSGELQTIPARHGVATFVPRGRTIKIINTYGKQVVSMWAFSLGAPPEKDEVEDDVNEVKAQEEAGDLKKAFEVNAGEEASTDKEKTDEEHNGQATIEEQDSPKDDAKDATDNGKSKETSENFKKQASKRTWASYLPSIPYRNKGAADKTESEKKPDAEEEKAQNEANTKKWSSYIPTGKSFSSYVPSMQIPDSKEAMSSFKASHLRDPNKSYAEQLYDFSKTPVGAGTIAAATGSGYASSVYAAYSAYASTHPFSSPHPPMEYLSLSHTRASTHKLVPEVRDELLTNLRNPILTFIEDTSPGAHDTLTAACDANQYIALGIDKPEEHGSCAENLVLALKELNETAGLKGAKAIGADISVNIAPTPLHLFMNAPLHLEQADSQVSGAKGITLSVEEPQGEKRTFVRFRAERDVVVVLSACPMDIGKQNGARCMAANFMVDDVQKSENSAKSSHVKGPKKLAPKEGHDAKPSVPEKPREEGKNPTQKQKQLDIISSSPEDRPKKHTPNDHSTVSVHGTSEPTQERLRTQDEAPPAELRRQKKKPRKLQPRAPAETQ